MTICLVGASFLILKFGLDTDQFSSDRTIAGYFVVAFLAVFVSVGMMSSKFFLLHSYKFVINLAWYVVSSWLH